MTQLVTKLLRRHRRRTATGLVMPRGPTGSRWALDAGGADGAIPAMPVPTYGSTSGASFTPFAQAADFYDSVGINAHSLAYGDSGRPTAISRIQEAGFRHVRGLGLWSPAIKNDPGMRDTQWWLIECMNANDARSRTTGGPSNTGIQPIFNCIGVDYERKYGVEFQTQNSYELADDDGGENFLRPMDGPPGQVNQTSFNWGGQFYGRNKTTSGAAIGWHGVGELQGPNEMDSREPHYFGSDYGLRWVARSYMRLRAAAARASTVIVPATEEYIDYNTGRITPGPATFKQLPVVGWAHFTGIAAWTAAGDYTDRQDCDFVAWHAYWNGTPPLWEYVYGPWAGNASGFFENANAVNGKLSPGGVKWSRSIPMIQTENGSITYLPQNPGITVPADVNGEILIQTLVTNYLMGMKRTYIYVLTHEGGEQGSPQPAMGILTTNFTRTEAFYAVKNLLGLVGWAQGPDEGVQPISIPHSWTPGATVNADSSTTSLPLVDRVYKLVLRRSATEYIIILCRLRPLWDRWDYKVNGSEAGARRTVSDPANTTLHLPAGTWRCSIAEPAKNTILSPTDGQTYANPTDGQAYAPAGMAGNGFTQSGNTLTVRMAGLTRVVRIVRDTQLFSAGLTSGTSSDDLTATQDLGAREVRVEFDIQTAATSIDSVIDAYAAVGTRVLLLADFASYMPTVSQAQNLGTWAARFGPGGTFWASRSDGNLAVQAIEFGNETSGGYQYGNDGPTDASYIQRAKDYASRFVSAHGAIAATGRPVGLLCNADDGGTGSSSWVDNMYVQVPTLHSYVSAWVCHPYGPGYVAKNTTMISQVAAHGAPTVPIDITECGIASDNGANLDANHGWATNMTYATAASTLSTVVSTLRGHSTIGPRLRRFMLYQVHDQSNPGADNGGEHYYGAVKHDLSAKGAYTAQVRSLLAS